LLVSGANIDISEHLKAERERAELAAIVESSDDAIISNTLDGVIVSWNAAAERIYGYSFSEIIGHSITILTPPEQHDEVDKILESIKRGEPIERLETTRLRNDGTRITVSLTISPVKNGKGEITGLSTIARDISEQKRAEQARRESEIRFRQLAENINEVFWVWTLQPEVLYVSPAYETIWGRSCESLYASPRSWRKAVHSQDEWVFEKIEKLDPEKQTDLTYRIVRPDQSIRWIRDRIFPVRDEHGVVVRFAGISEDITEIKLTEEALRESESKFRRLLASNITGVVFWTLQGDILDANDLFLNMVGYTKEDLRPGNLSWKKLTPPEHAQVDEKAVAELVATGTSTPFEKEYIRKDGTRVSVLIGSTLLEPQKDVGSSFVMDITERKKGEEQLEHYAHLLQILSRRRIQVQEDERRRLSRELHDQIGQLLTAGNINLQSVRKTKNRQVINKKLDETIAILEQILKQVRQISFDIRPPVLDDLGLAPAMRWMLDDTVTRAGLTAEFFADPDLKRGDVESETACYRVGLEAVTNVVRHAQARKVWLELRNAGDALQLRIRDDGIGFNPAEAEKGVRRDRLGLVGMRERATALGGQFECNSAPGRGAEVRALFPISLERHRIEPL
jgi:PAS domain S-box-containing protein